MKLSHITLQNFRRYEAVRFHFHERFTVLIGNNGKGKTTVLDAVAMMLNTYFQGSRLPTGGGNIGKADARVLLTEKEGQVFREQKTDVSLHATARVAGSELSWQRDIGDRGGKAKNLVWLGTQARERIQQGESPDLPLLLYYGAGRLWNIHVDIETEKPSSQLDAYRYCLDPKSDQKAFEKWFKKLAFTEPQKRTRIPATDVVRQAVMDMAALPTGIAAPGPGTPFSNRSIEDIAEGVMGVPLPQRSQRYQDMYDAAQAYYQVLQQAAGADDATRQVLKARLDELSAPFSDNVAYHAFLEMERLAAGLGKSQPSKEA